MIWILYFLFFNIVLLVLYKYKRVRDIEQFKGRVFILVSKYSHTEIIVFI